MNRKRLGQALIGGVITVCAAVIAALIDLASKEDAPRDGRSGPGAFPRAGSDGVRPAAADTEENA